MCCSYTICILCIKQSPDFSSVYLLRCKRIQSQTYQGNWCKLETWLHKLEWCRSGTAKKPEEQLQQLPVSTQMKQVTPKATQRLTRKEPLFPKQQEDVPLSYPLHLCKGTHWAMCRFRKWEKGSLKKNYMNQQKLQRKGKTAPVGTFVQPLCQGALQRAFSMNYVGC